MNINWGTGIAIFSASFMLMILGFVVNSFQHRVDLVSADYYQQEIAHQQQINKVQQAERANMKVSHQIIASDGAGEVQIQFPTATAKGNMLFFRPSNAKQDFKVAIAPTAEGKQNVRNALLTSGLWRIKIDWSNNGEAYYQELTLVMP